MRGVGEKEEERERGRGEWGEKFSSTHSSPSLPTMMQAYLVNF